MKISFNKVQPRCPSGLNLFVILITALLFLINIWQNRYFYTQPFDLKLSQFRFEHSQYSPAKQLFFINDWELYPLAGYNYLKTWNLDQINPEHPPLGKYLFGISILLFKNPAVLQPFFGLFCLILLFLIAEKFLQSKLLASLVVFLFSLERLFVSQLSLSLLDLAHLAFLLLLTWSILQKRKVLSAFSLGTFAAAKAPMPALTASLAILFQLYICHSGTNAGVKPAEVIESPQFATPQGILSLRSRMTFINWLKINLIALFVFLLTYLPFILKTGFNNFSQLIIKAIKIHLSHVPEYPVGPVYGALFANFWRTWWDPNNLFWQVEGWNIAWPILGLFFLLSPFIFWRYFKKLKSFVFIYFFSWFYFIFISGRLFFPGYLLILLPFLYLIAFKTIIFSLEGRFRG